jgi:Lon protease-like protein
MDADAFQPLEEPLSNHTSARFQSKHRRFRRIFARLRAESRSRPTVRGVFAIFFDGSTVMRTDQMPHLPDSLPVIILEKCNVFPKGLLPLYIFESRYQAMLTEALASHRMFCVATVNPDQLPELNAPPVFPHSTASLIRACIGNEDGTSHLILEGRKRVRFIDWDDSRPFWQARIETVPTRDDDPARTAELAGQALKLVRGFIARGLEINEPLVGHLDALSTPEDIADFLGYHFLANPMDRQPLLGMTSLTERLEFLITSLGALASET